MKSFSAYLVAGIFGIIAVTSASPAPQTQPAPGGGGTDLYHVHFTKAAPGQAAALGKALIVPDKTMTMPEHFVVLRHQEGDDWDYLVIQHLGQKATIDAAPAAPNAARDLRAWHNDTFASGVAWPEFTKQMGLGSSEATAAVYTVGVHRALPGHREDLLKSLTQPSPSKVQTGNVVLQHIEGADWNFLALTRYNSWQDFATDRSSAIAAADQGGWAEIRQHSAFHRDTVADRISK
jgi:hypothetical protein